MKIHGVDLHPSFFVVYSKEVGKEGFFRSFRTEAKEIAKFRDFLGADDKLAVEATGNAHWFIGQVIDCVESVSMVNPRKFDIIRKSTDKTDKNDARALAYFLEKDLLPESRMKPEEQRDLAALNTSRDRQVKQRTSYVNRIHSYYVAIGIRLKKESLTRPKHLNNLELDMFSEYQRFDIENCRDQILHLNGIIKNYEKKMKALAESMDGFETMVSFVGINVVTASTLLGSIGNGSTFASEKQMSSHLGLTPENRHSAGKMRNGRISKKGDKLAKIAFLQATMSTIQHVPFFQSYYSKKRSEGGNHGRALIATARKLLKLLFRALKNNWVFKDFRNYVLAN